MSNQPELDLQSFLVSPQPYDPLYGHASNPSHPSYNASIDQDQAVSRMQSTNAYAHSGSYDSNQLGPHYFSTDQMRQQQAQHQQQLPNNDRGMSAGTNSGNLSGRRPYSQLSTPQNSNNLQTGQTQHQGVRSDETALHDLDPNAFNSVSFAMPRFLEGGHNAALASGAAIIDAGMNNPIEAQQFDLSNAQPPRNFENFSYDTLSNMPYMFDTNALLPDNLLGSAGMSATNSLSGQAKLPNTGQPSGSARSAQFPGVYSATGFDVVGILARIALRPHPQIDLGPVDLSSSFLVVDAQKYDFPIVYASPTFSKLTGYNQDECTGRNCRFLQAPDGMVALGTRRQHTDNQAVYHIKTHMLSGKECQASMVNYRKGGQSFINLVTVIPITWNSDEVSYFIGFQIDLVEQPNAILNRLKDGTYVVNHSHTAKLPRSLPLAKNSQLISGSEKSEGSDSSKVEKTPSSSVSQPVMPVSKQDSPEIMDIIEASGDSEVSKRQWNRMLLEHSDDFIHVLSLKGVFLYASPSVKQLLGFSPEDLSGKNISMICHPSDVVPVMRELKESTTGLDDVNFVYRIRQKKGTYIWMEAHGKLHLEHGKGRKCVIMVGRQRSVYKLQLGDLDSTQDPVQTEDFWAKLSLDGMVLYASPSIRDILGYNNRQMIGTNMTTLIDPSQQGKFVQSLSRGGDGKIVLYRIRGKDNKYISLLATPHRNQVEKGSDSGSETFEQPFVICQFVLQDQPRSENLQQASNAEGADPSGSDPLIRPPLGSFWKALKTQSRSASDNIFDGLDTRGSTSWQYELHQLRLTNKKLREEIEGVIAARERRNEKVGPACPQCKREGTLDRTPTATGTVILCNACGARSGARQQAAESRVITPPSEASESVSSNESSQIPDASATQNADGTMDSSRSGQGESDNESGMDEDDVGANDGRSTSLYATSPNPEAF